MIPCREMGNGGMQGKTGKEKEDKTVIQEKNAEIAVYTTIEEAEKKLHTHSGLKQESCLIIACRDGIFSHLTK